METIAAIDVTSASRGKQRAECRGRQREWPPLTEFVTRHPELADEIRDREGAGRLPRSLTVAAPSECFSLRSDRPSAILKLRHRAGPSNSRLLLAPAPLSSGATELSGLPRRAAVPKFRLAVFVLVGFFLPSGPIFGQERHGYAAVGFDQNGKVEDADAWGTLKKDVKDTAPTDVFILAHGWRTSRLQADVLFDSLGKLLHEQTGKHEKIQIIGMRWPSLIGEGDTTEDTAFKQAAALLSAKLGKSENVKQWQAKLKESLNSDTIAGKVRRVALAKLLDMELPDDEQLGLLIDNMHEPGNVATLLSVCSYYQMKKRAETVGAGGVQTCLTELQETLPGCRFHLVGHSFGCKVCLASLACEKRQGKQVDSVTLLQGAVSTYCFTPKIAVLDQAPAGAYAELSKRVTGCFAFTFTQNDKALAVAYVAASQAAGQVGELPTTRFWQLKLDAYGALGGCGARDVPGVPALELAKSGTPYPLRRGLNAFNADNIVRSHSDVCREEIAWLIWSAARYRP
jgi:hypothetical protein